MYALFKETSHANFISHKSNYGKNPVANPKNWVAFDGQHVHYSTNNLDLLTQELVWYFRKTAGDDNESIFNDRATITAIKGNSVKWNQKFPNTSYSFSEWNTLQAQPCIENHKYVIIGTASRKSNGSGNDYQIYLTGAVRNTLYSIHNNAITPVSKCPYVFGTIFTAATSSNIVVSSAKYNNFAGAVSGKLFLIDLTAIYGFGNEPSSVMNFINDYHKWFGNSQNILDEPYDVGSIRNTKINALKTIGFNQFYEQMTNGTISLDGTGEPSFGGGDLVTTNYIPVLPNTNYYIYSKNPSQYTTLFRYYYFDDLYISNSSGHNIEINIPQYINNMRFVLYQASTKGYGTSYKNDICINISDSKLNGVNERYEDRTYSIPITSITGKLNGSGNSVVVFPEGMKSAGSICDEIVVEGGVTKAIKRVGTINLHNILNLFYGEGNYVVIPIRNVDMKPSGSMIISYGLNNLSIRSGTNDGGQGFFTTDFGNNVTTAQNALDNHIVNFELWHPQTYVLDNFNLPINAKVWKSGTERYEFNSVGTTPKLTIHYNAQ